jgi:sec-independent protein translocase protein TatA
MLVPAIGMPGPFELTLIVVLVLILFGVGRLPQVFESLGKGIKSFRDAQKDVPPVQDTPAPRIEAEDVEEVDPT